MIYYFKKYHKTLSIIFIITLLSLINTSKIKPDDLSLIPHFDKIVHFLMYFTLGFVFMFEYYIHHHQTITRISKILILPLLYGGLMELLQISVTTYRSGDWWDMLANGCGILTAYFIVKSLRNNTFFRKWMLFPLKQPMFKA
ncbi:VanZ family protein [Carboxylicivirga mesophila]|uniref:VanZ family protein n=1 Tax=Carboxylicivirga mesophila TaxID=1166478 RepID=A0ABS5KDD6_9BACT|nr:VanZ family protein [Carboxylicivirga mesophila]MBS2212513.1 VanZ family protein [Carboxylicivirga mesophila]